MDGSPNYAYEKLCDAVDLMATAPGDVRDRLRGAYRIFHPIRAVDFPEPLRHEWGWVIAQLTKFGPMHGHDGRVYRGSVEHTLSRIRRKTGSRIAHKIVDIKYGLERELRQRGEI